MSLIQLSSRSFKARILITMMAICKHPIKQ